MILHGRRWSTDSPVAWRFSDILFLVV